VIPKPKEPYFIEPQNPNDPDKLDNNNKRNVLVIGAGLAGLSASLELAERGYDVTLREVLPVIGGKLATPQITTKVGKFHVEHGLHMWFYNYFCCKDIMDRLGVRNFFRDYRFVNVYFKDYKPEVIQSEPPIFPFNLISILERSPNVGLIDMRHMVKIVPDLMYFDFNTVYDHFDSITFEEWAHERGVTEKIYSILFEPGASVTINDPKTISAAELIMWTHYFFIGHPKAMWREIAIEDHWNALLKHWQARLEEKNTKIQTGKPVTGLRFKNGMVVGEVGSEEIFDFVVLASDVISNKKIIRNSVAEDEVSAASLNKLKEKFAQLKIAPAYRILRVWFDKKTNPDRPDVIETPQFRPLHLLAQFHLLEGESKAWSEKTGGSVIEFHFYADPEIAGLSEEQVWEKVKPIILQVLPELKDAKVLDTVIGTYHNFTSYDVGQGTIRPSSDFPSTNGIKNLFFAGDWVKTDYPSALMERAVSTGRLAANHILLKDNVKQAPIKVANSLGPGLF
jgi:isorenieratene synthase